MVGHWVWGEASGSGAQGVGEWCSGRDGFSVDSLIQGIKRMNSSTAIGQDGMSIGMLKEAPREALEVLADILGDVLSSPSLPVGWMSPVVCLIPKPGGGRRPIGLLPSMVRLWMRIRLDVARSWQSAYDRPFFYAGPKKGAKVASWKQAARAELAATGSFMEWACGLLDLVKAYILVLGPCCVSRYRIGEKSGT